MLEKHPQDLKLFHPWLVTAEEAIDLACRTEAAAYAVDKRISNCEGASVHAQQSHFVAANSRGFVGGYPFSRHTISVAPIAGKGSKMQRDDWYSSHRNHKKIATPEAIGGYAAERALARLNARTIDTRKCPVLFEAPLAAGLLGAFVQAVSGGALYRKSTFLLDTLGKQVFPNHIQVLEDPHVLGAVGSSPFDDEGVKTLKREVVTNGVLNGYFLSTYSARKLGMQTTGNAGGSHNLNLTSNLTKRGDNFAQMLKKMGTGLLVTELMGQGVNYVTGDYSRGASGFWVENGVIQYPVEEITIAGNMREMFEKIVAIGNDTLTRGTKTTGSILIESMTVAGS
jgi:PmbA protein